MKSAQLQIQTLTIDGIEYAKYIVEGTTLYLKVIKNIGRADEQLTEVICCNLIAALKGVMINHTAYLNLIEQ